MLARCLSCSWNGLQNDLAVWEETDIGGPCISPHVRTVGVPFRMEIDMPRDRAGMQMALVFENIGFQACYFDPNNAGLIRRGA